MNTDHDWMVVAFVQAVWSSVFLILNLGMFVMAIRHRHDISGAVWALLWIGEQIHMTPPKLGAK